MWLRTLVTLPVSQYGEPMASTGCRAHRSGCKPPFVERSSVKIDRNSTVSRIEFRTGKSHETKNEHLTKSVEKKPKK